MDNYRQLDKCLTSGLVSIQYELVSNLCGLMSNLCGLVSNLCGQVSIQCPTRKLLALVWMQLDPENWDLISNQNRKWTFRETDDTLWHQTSSMFSQSHSVIFLEKLWTQNQGFDQNLSTADLRNTFVCGTACQHCLQHFDVTNKLHRM